MKCPSSSHGPKYVFLSLLKLCFLWTFLHSDIFSSAGSVYLTDLLHGGGRRAGDAPAEQLQTHPPHLQSRRLSLQRRPTPQRGGRAAPRVGSVAVSAPDPFARKLYLRTAVISLNHDTSYSSVYPSKQHLDEVLWL